MKQNWTCTGCEVKSTVDIPDGASIMKNYNIIESDHQRISPECNNPVVSAGVFDIGHNPNVVVRVVEEKIGQDCAHYWVWQWVPEQVRCYHCKEQIPWGEVERRLNAVEHLNAQDARNSAEAVLGDTHGDEYTAPLAGQLEEYAKALETRKETGADY